jgi:hypothetical protein
MDVCTKHALAAELWERSRMGVDDPALKRLERPRSYLPQIASQNNQVNLACQK